MFKLKYRGETTTVGSYKPWNTDGTVVDRPISVLDNGCWAPRVRSYRAQIQWDGNSARFFFSTGRSRYTMLSNRTNIARLQHTAMSTVIQCLGNRYSKSWKKHFHQIRPKPSYVRTTFKHKTNENSLVINFFFF